jgi:hypothetical protein
MQALPVRASSSRFFDYASNSAARAAFDRVEPPSATVCKSR